ncbi:MAG: DUF1932 domain-containing protein, partial [Actinomycetota bacterium]
VGEMEEIAATMANAGLPDGFHRAAADLYGRMAGFKGSDGPSLDAVLDTVLAGLPSPGPDDGGGSGARRPGPTANVGDIGTMEQAIDPAATVRSTPPPAA